jgi:ADP-ribose pyrophosphatase YjhB (NUDIX family)
MLFDGDRVLLLRRKGSGYRDGMLSLPAGHLDGDESVESGLRRELQEELGIKVTAYSLAAVMHRRRETPADDEYIDFFFWIDSWDGTPHIVEPHKCAELVWAPVDALPPDVVGYVREAITSDTWLITQGWGG